MKRYSLLTLLLLTLTLSASAAVTFTDPNYKNLLFKVLDEDAKTVSVKAINKKDYYTKDSALNIPQSVYNGEYTVIEIDTLGFNTIKIARISLPSTIQRIDSGAFRNITTSFTIKFNEGLVEIGDRAFCASTGLKGTMVLPSTLQTIGSSASFLNTSIDSFIIKSEIPPIFTKNEHTKYPLPSVPILVPCNTWKDFATKWNAYKQNLVDPCFPTALINNIFYGVTEMGAVAIDYLTVPEGELIFPESITVKDQLLDVVAIGDSAFLGTKVTKIVLPSSVVSIGKAAFRNIVTTFTIELNEGLIEIGDRAFTNSTGMVGTLTLPSTLKSIYSSAALRNIAVDAIEVKAKDAPVFLSNEHKVHPLPDVPINIPCESWKNYARVNSNGSTWNAYKSRLTDPCTKLVDNYYYTATDSGAVVVGYDVAPAGILTFPTTVTINELPFNVVAIGDFAFDAMKITSLEIPSSIVYLGKGAFRKCVNLSTVTLNEGLRNIDDSCFYGCTFTAIQMPRTLKQIGKYAFRTNTEMTTIVLNEGLEIIGERAFTGNIALKDTLVIPSTVKEFGAATFTNCNLISCVIFKGMTPPNVVNEGDRNPIFSNPEVRYIIPCRAMDNYKNAYYWKNLSSRFVSACKPLNLTKEVTLTQDTIVSSISYSRTFDMDVWQTLYLPFEVDSVLVEEIYEGEPYYFDINKPYDPAIGGYFYLNKYHTTNAEEATITFSTATTLEGFTPYLIQFPQISSDGYFDGKNIIFKSKPGEYTLKKSDYTQPDATKQFQVSGNSSVYNQSVSDMYIFRATLVTGKDGTPLKTVDGKDSVKYEFNRQASATLKPFEFGLLPYVVEPSSGISSAPMRMSLRIGRSSGNTGGGDITTSVSETHAPNAITYRTGAGELALSLNGLPCQLYSVSGTLLYSSTGGTEEITIPLEKGIYILYSEGKSQKIVL